VRIRSIQFQIMTLIAAVGILLSLLLAVVGPLRTRRVGRVILENDARFTAGILAENLALGMLTLPFDDGAAIGQTLDLLRSGTAREAGTLTDVRVFDARGGLVRSLREGAAPAPGTRARVDTVVTVTETRKCFTVRSPLRDSDGAVLGSVEIDFSKAFLDRQVSRNAITDLILAAIVFLSALAAGTAVGRHVSAGIRESAAVMCDIAEGEGDLTRRLRMDSDDEVGDLEAWINRFMDQVQGLIEQVRLNVEQVAETTAKIGETASRLSAESDVQRAGVDSVVSDIRRLADAVVQNARHANQSADLAEEAASVAKEGKTAVGHTHSRMDDIVRGAGQVGRVIHSLSDRTREIEGVLDVIRDIAQRTNLLAVNANIEAVHAGELGVSFSVVADEIRTLSERTEQSARLVDETVKAVLKEYERVLRFIEDNDTAVTEGKKTVRESEAVLQRILGTVESAIPVLRQIATDAQSESSGAKDISEHVVVIGSGTRRTAEGVSEMAEAVRELNGRTETLRQAIRRFRLR
jgi:methyl-accepting chemotaxis protein